MSSTKKELNELRAKVEAYRKWLIGSRENSGLEWNYSVDPITATEKFEEIFGVEVRIHR